ncbi:MAG: hypothetical protein H9802_13330 [Candidatus Phocaeicola faecipullorum]|nr:hypothetical protein [Candidatus Phocaeicola faecipullorum]
MRLKFFFSMLAAAAIALTGCNKDQTELEINYGKSAIVKGKVILNDGTSTTKAGANIKVYAQIKYADLVTTNTTLEGTKTFETITDTEGKYQFELPVKDNGTDISIYTETVEVENGYYASKTGNANNCKPNIISYVTDITLSLTKTTTNSGSSTGDI